MKEIQITELPIERWREYRELRLAALQSDPIAYSSTYEESVAYPDEVWRDRLSNPVNIMLFAERGGRLVGSATALMGIDDDPATAQIVGVFVERTQRGQGIGRLLLETLLARIAEHGEIARIQLGVTETQTPAIALYTALGFVMTGRLEGEITSGGRSYDELVMEQLNR